jgi:hypothetical protein
VTLRFAVFDWEIWLEVSDEGNGFAPAAIPNPCAPERRTLPSGRGLLLMRTFMTRVCFNAAGNRVVMLMRRGAECPWRPSAEAIRSPTSIGQRQSYAPADAKRKASAAV